MPLPVLYSLRQCPYAMRARLGLLLAKHSVILRDITMNNIPNEMLVASPKGTVPVLVHDDFSVIDESLDIMIWALKENDPKNLLFSHQPNALENMLKIIERNDNEFIDSLNKYKAASRYHDNNKISYRQQCEPFIAYLNKNLAKYEYIMGEHPSLVDYALLPFIRQFSRVERQWYIQSPYPYLKSWLNKHYQDPIFSKAMTKYPPWLDSQEVIIFGSV